MSVQLTRYFRVDGTLTDPTSFVYGVTRTDTGATVVASSTAMTKASTGVYTASWDEPTSGLLYEVSFSAVYGGNTTAWTEIVDGSSTEALAQIELTGDDLVDSLNSLVRQRLQLIRLGAKPDYSVDGKVLWIGRYLRELDARIMSLRREIAMSDPLEEIGMGL